MIGLLWTLGAAGHEVQGQRLPGVETESIQHPLEIVPHGVRAQPEALSDGHVREPFGREQGDLGLASSEPEGDAQFLRGRKPRAEPID